jgi:inhibitor of KinA
VTRLAPLGDQAVLAYLPDEAAAVRFADAVRTARPPWLQDVVPAYASVGVFFDADLVRGSEVRRWLGELTPSEEPPGGSRRSARHLIPVCYEMQLDTARVCDRTGVSADDVIRLHTGAEFTVYAIGFVPGFPYLGYLPEPLCGVPRLESPRVRVEPGSVGLTGKQTGIYPLPRPGGWNLIGRTPLTIVDVADDFFPIRVGDRVQFERIDDTEFRRLEGERLSVM